MPSAALRRAILVSLLPLAAAACGASSALPPPAKPAPGGRCVAARQSRYISMQLGCASGRLVSLAAPHGAAEKSPALPAEAALPAGSKRVAIPDPNWTGAGNVIAAAGSIWATSDATAWRIDEARLSVTGPFGQGSGDGARVAAGDGALWLTDFDGGVVHRLDPVSGQQVTAITLPAPGNPAGIVALPGAVWVAAHRSGTILRIDPATNRVVASVLIGEVGSSGPLVVASGLGSLWVSVPNINAVVRVDPERNEVTAFIPLPRDMSACGDIGVSERAVWVTSCLGGRKVVRIDPKTNKVAAVLYLGGEALDIAVVGQHAFLVAGGDPDSSPTATGDLLELTADDSVAARYSLGSGFISGGVAFDSGALWLSDFAHPVVMRVPLTG